MTAFLTRMPTGVAGTVTRATVSITKPIVLDTANVPASYGLPVKLVGDKIQACTAASDTVYGFIVRPYPSQQTTGGMTASLGAGAPLGGTVVDVLVSGYITVVSAGGTPSKTAAVNLSAAGAVTAGAGTAIPRAMFEGAADTSGNVELAFNV